MFYLSIRLTFSHIDLNRFRYVLCGNIDPESAHLEHRMGDVGQRTCSVHRRCSWRLQYSDHYLSIPIVANRRLWTRSGSIHHRLWISTQWTSGEKVSITTAAKVPSSISEQVGSSGSQLFHPFRRVHSSCSSLSLSHIDHCTSPVAGDRSRCLWRSCIVWRAMDPRWINIERTSRANAHSTSTAYACYPCLQCLMSDYYFRTKCHFILLLVFLFCHTKCHDRCFSSVFDMIFMELLNNEEYRSPVRTKIDGLLFSIYWTYLTRQREEMFSYTWEHNVFDHLWW